MLRAAALLLTLAAPALAQSPPPVAPQAVEQKLRQQLGDLMFTVTVLTVQVEHLQRELEKARAKDAKPAQ